MKTHAVEEKINNLLLYIQIDPEPPQWTIKIEYVPGLVWRCLGENLDTDIMPIGCPISIGDAVYQGEEWWRDEHYRAYLRSAFNPIIDTEPLNWEPPETMPIHLADKTFKVVKIEVETVTTFTSPPVEKPIHIDRWFWKYALEERGLDQGDCPGN